MTCISKIMTFGENWEVYKVEIDFKKDIMKETVRCVC